MRTPNIKESAKIDFSEFIYFIFELLTMSLKLESESMKNIEITNNDCHKIVNESGGEIITLPDGSQVIPNNVSQQIKDVIIE